LHWIHAAEGRERLDVGYCEDGNEPLVQKMGENSWPIEEYFASTEFVSCM